MGTTTTTRRDTGVGAFIWRHRVGLAPIIAGVLVALIGTIVKYSGVADYVATILYLVLGLVWFGANFRMQIEAGVAKIHRKQELWYIGTVVASTVAWLFFYHYMETTWVNVQNLFLVWLVGMLVLAGPYWFNIRRRVQVRLENMMEAWPKLASGTSLSKSRWATFTKTDNGWTGILTWDKGVLSRRRVKDEIELMESLTDAPPDSVVIETLAGKGNVNKVKVTCVEDDPHTEAIPFDGKIATSIKDLVSLGKYTDHQEERTRWWEDGVGGFHRLFAGATRTGKSGLMHLLVAKYGPAVDVRPWFADLKGGTALLPWSPLADWAVTTAEEALAMLQAGAQEVDRRARVCAARGTEVWEPTEKDPVIIIFFDEIASLIGDSAPNAIAQPARQAIVEIARKGAGMGVLLVPATQYPTLSALGDSQFKSQLSWRACFRLNQPEQGHYVLPSMPKGVDPYRIPKSRRGTCYIDAEGEFRPAMLRVQYVDRGDIERVVEQYGRKTPDDPNGPRFLDGIENGWSSEDLKEVYRARRRWSIEDLEALKRGESVAGTDATDDDLHDHEDVPDMSTEDDMDDDTPDNVVSIGRVNYAESELGKAVQNSTDGDPQAALREAKEREAWLSARRPSVAMLEDAIMEALRGNHEEGVSPRELAVATGKSERTIHRYLERLKDEGKVIRLGYGRYRLTVSPVRH